MQTETEVEEKDWVPREFWPALDATPDCQTLLGAVADFMAESGDEVGAEALRWCLIKGRWTKTGWNRAGRNPPLPWNIPDSLFDKVLLRHNCMSGSSCYGRLIWRWSLCTEEERREYWNWQPPQ